MPEITNSSHFTKLLAGCFSKFFNQQKNLLTIVWGNIIFYVQNPLILP